MKDTNWMGHYTGIDTREIEFLGRLFDLYLQRDTKTKKLSFARFSINIQRIKFFHHIGIFIGHQNHCNYNVSGGVQLFTNLFHIGIGKPVGSNPKWLRVEYSGSMVDPHCHVSFIFFGRLNFGCDTPKRFQKMKRRQAEKEWEKEAAAYEEAFGPDFIGDCGDGTMTNPDQEK